MTYFGLSDALFRELERLKRSIEIAPINLGGVVGPSGGVDGRPGGFLGYLPQTRITYDETELGTATTSGNPNLLDNLNHIRGRIDILESGGGGANALDDLTDVVITTPSEGQALVYDDGTGKWINDTISGSAHDQVTLAGTPNYLILSDQEITLEQIDLTADVTGVLPNANVATDISLTDITQITNRSHTDLSDIGTNDHDDIDIHLADTDSHLPVAASGIDHDALLNFDSDEHFTEASIDHTAITNIGTYDHDALDTHIDDTESHLPVAASGIDHDALLNFESNEHFTESSIDHENISNIGSKTHDELDTHVDDVASHLPVAASGIDHDQLLNFESSEHFDEINELSDVVITTPSDGQSLVYDSDTSKWINATPSGEAHDAVTLAGTPDYISIDGQELTLEQIDLENDVSGTLPDANVATDISLDNITQITNRSHTNLSDIGSNAHSSIDTHIADTDSHLPVAASGIDHDLLLNFESGEHFTESSIDHTSITNIGSNPHSAIDTHIANDAIHGSGGGGITVIDQSGGTGDTYTTLSGEVNDSNTLFGVSEGEYDSGTLAVWLNGQLQTQGSGEDWTETNPTIGTFSFNTAPLTGDELTAMILGGGASGDASTLEGIDASGFVQVGELAFIPGGRLSLTTDVPVTTADVTAATTIYYVPYKHDYIQLHNGSKWINILFTEKTVSVPATTVTPFDIFGYLSGGALVLETLDWTNDTTRATALAYQNGRLIKSGDATRLYLGTGRTTGVSGQIEDSVTKRFIWNLYNQTDKILRKTDSTYSWTYSGSYRQANGDSDNKVEIVLGLVRSVAAEIICTTYHATTVRSARVGVGLDSTSTMSADNINGLGGGNDAYTVVIAKYRGFSAEGYHYLAWLESASNTLTFFGSDDTTRKSGISGDLLG